MALRSPEGLTDGQPLLLGVPPASEGVVLPLRVKYAGVSVALAVEGAVSVSVGEEDLEDRVEKEGEGVEEVLPVTETENAPLRDALGDVLPLPLGDCVELVLTLRETVGVAEGRRDGLPVLQGVCVPLARVRVAGADTVGFLEGLPVVEPLAGAVGAPVALEQPLGAGDCEGDKLAAALLLAEGLAKPVTEASPVREEEGETDTEGLTLALADTDGEPLGEGVADRLPEALEDRVGEGLADAQRLDECVAEGLRVTVAQLLGGREPVMVGEPEAHREPVAVAHAVPLLEPLRVPEPQLLPLEVCEKLRVAVGQWLEVGEIVPLREGEPEVEEDPDSVGMLAVAEAVVERDCMLLAE